MDDLNAAFGGQAPKTPLEEAWHSAQERKKYDVIRVKNPTNEDFYVKYDIGKYQKVPANSTIDIPRYMATRYVEHMKDKIVHDKAQKMHDAQIAEKDKKGLPVYTDKYTENKETYETANYPKTDNPAVIAPIFDELWVGVVHEFGLDQPPTNQPKPGEVDMATASQKILDGLDKKRVPMNERATEAFQPQSYQPPTQPIAPQPSPFANMNNKLSVDEITA